VGVLIVAGKRVRVSGYARVTKKGQTVRVTRVRAYGRRLPGAAEERQKDDG
jgi:hypothetical protein